MKIEINDFFSMVSRMCIFGELTGMNEIIVETLEHN